MQPKSKENQDTTVYARDLDQIITFPAGEYNYDGQVDLVKATLKYFRIEEPLEISIHSDLPPGSGLATSSSLIVALIGVCARLRGQNLSNYEVANLAYHLEREELASGAGTRTNSQQLSAGSTTSSSATG